MVQGRQGAFFGQMHNLWSGTLYKYTQNCPGSPLKLRGYSCTFFIFSARLSAKAIGEAGRSPVRKIVLHS